MVTVAHCVYSPELKLWWPGLEFSPARNGRGSWSPHGTSGWRHAEVPERCGRAGGQAQAGRQGSGNWRAYRSLP